MTFIWMFCCFVVCCPSCNTGCCVVSLWVCEWESKTTIGVLTDWVVKSVSHSWSIYSGVLIDWVVKSTNTNLYQDLFRCQSSLACDVGSGEILYREPPRNNKWEKKWEPLTLYHLQHHQQQQHQQQLLLSLLVCCYAPLWFVCLILWQSVKLCDDFFSC